MGESRRALSVSVSPGFSAMIHVLMVDGTVMVCVQGGGGGRQAGCDDGGCVRACTFSAMTPRRTRPRSRRASSRASRRSPALQPQLTQRSCCAARSPRGCTRLRRLNRWAALPRYQVRACTPGTPGRYGSKQPTASASEAPCSVLVCCSPKSLGRASTGARVSLVAVLAPFAWSALSPLRGRSAHCPESSSVSLLSAASPDTACPLPTLR